jgi:hypothetical protein
MITINFFIFPSRKTDYIDCLIGYVSMLQEGSSMCSISCVFHNTNEISLCVLKQMIQVMTQKAESPTYIKVI